MGCMSRLRAFVTVFIIYLLAFLGFLLVHRLVYQENLLLSSFCGDIAATLVVWFFGVLYRNSSLYDPYWSVAPLFLLSFWLIFRQNTLDMADTLFLIAVSFWGIRLTLNWAVRWSGLRHQDWRYTQLKEQHPRWWFLVNLSGINMMPTLVVFVAMIPVYMGVFHKAEGIPLLLWLGFVCAIAAAAIQLVADKQMDLFKNKRISSKEYIDEGIWRYSRHPNYFGEIFLWWGLWLMQMGVNSAIWYTVAGPVLMTLLFAVVSIPLMERHILQSKPAYVSYQQTVSVLIPWFRREHATATRSGCC